MPPRLPSPQASGGSPVSASHLAEGTAGPWEHAIAAGFCADSGNPHSQVASALLTKSHLQPREELFNPDMVVQASNLRTQEVDGRVLSANQLMLQWLSFLIYSDLIRWGEHRKKKKTTQRMVNIVWVQSSLSWRTCGFTMKPTFIEQLLHATAQPMHILPLPILILSGTYHSRSLLTASVLFKHGAALPAVSPMPLLKLHSL